MTHLEPVIALNEIPPYFDITFTNTLPEGETEFTFSFEPHPGYDSWEIESIESIELKKILQNDYHSMFIFRENKRTELDVKQMSGLMLDFDESLTIEEAESIFNSYTYILYSSKSHQQKKKKGKTFIPERDRFHIILPFEEPINIFSVFSFICFEYEHCAARS